MADKERYRPLGWLGGLLRGWEHEVVLLNAWGWITSKDKPWELAEQIAARKERERERETEKGQKASGG